MLFVPLVASVALLAGCTEGGPSVTPTPTTNGLDGKTAEEILEAASDAMSGADSFKVSGSGGEAPLTFDLDLTFAGEDIEGTVTLLGVEVNVKKVGATLFVNADPAFWASTLGDFLQDATDEELNALATQLGSGWASAPAALAAGVIPVPLSVDDLFGADAVPTPLTKGEVTELDGQPVITFTDADGSIFSIALEGEPYVLQIETDGEPVTFSDFNEDVTIEEPDNVVDLLEVLGMG